METRYGITHLYQNLKMGGAFDNIQHTNNCLLNSCLFNNWFHVFWTFTELFYKDWPSKNPKLFAFDWFKNIRTV